MHDNNQNSCFYENMNTYSLTPIIFHPTRFDDRTCSLIDNVFVSNCNNIVSGLLCTDISDHLPIFIMYHNYFDVNVSSKLTTIRSRCVNSYTLNQLYNTMLNENLIDYHSTNLDEHIELLHSKLLQNFYSCCPIKTKTISPKDKLKPWIDSNLKILMKRRQNFFNLYKQNLVSKQFYNYYRNMVTKKIRISKQRYYEELFIKLKNNIRKTWNVINSIISSKAKKCYVC